MVGADHLDPAEGLAVVAADRDHAAVEALAEDPLELGRDRQRRLAGTDHDHAPGRIELVALVGDRQQVAVERHRGGGGAGDVAAGEAGGREAERGGAGAAHAAARERLGVLDRRHGAGRRGRGGPGGWIDRGHGFARQAATGVAARASPG